jgi:cytochrome c oxidase assembly factor CtaG
LAYLSPSHVVVHAAFSLHVAGHAALSSHVAVQAALSPPHVPQQALSALQEVAQPVAGQQSASLTAPGLAVDWVDSQPIRTQQTHTATIEISFFIGKHSFIGLARSHAGVQ